MTRLRCLLFGHRTIETGLLFLEGHVIPVLRCQRCGAES